MATLVRVKTVHHLDANGNRCAAGTPGSRRVVVTSRKWYATGVPGWPKGKRVPLSEDRRAAQKMLTDLIVAAERGSAGVVMPAARIELAPLVAEFLEQLERKSGSKHVRDAGRLLRATLAACSLTTLGELLAPGAAARVERYIWSLTKDRAPRTAALSGVHVKHFGRWLFRKKELCDRNPLEGVDLPGQKSQEVRRAYTVAEVTKLIAHVERAENTIRGLSAPDRAALYALAVTTGLRAGELRSLTPTSFRLTQDPPVVVVKGVDTKNNQDAILPLAAEVVERIRPMLSRGNGPLWPGRWWDKASKMIRLDLVAAGIVPDTADGVGNFHSLRHTFVTLLGQSASTKVTQELARHSSPLLTIARYTHTDMDAKASAVNSILGQPAAMSREELEAWLAVFATLFATVFATDVDLNR